MNRKTFLKSATLLSGAALTGTSAYSAKSYRRIIGANDRLGIAMVGTGRRGREVMQAMQKTGRAECVALCDIWGTQLQLANDQLQLKDVFKTFDLQEALNNPKVDGVLIATPDHLHAGYAKAVLHAGHHLFLEKPSTLYFEEGNSLLQQVKASGKTCQTGTQQRSGSLYKRVKEEYFSGSKKLGEVVFVRAIWSDFAWQRRKIEPRPLPNEFDWERFLGPAPKIPYDWARYDAWRNYKDYGAGILSDLLTHWADVAQWMLDDTNPVSAVTTGGIYFLNDGRNNPDTVNSIIQYKNWNLSFECSVMPVLNERQSILFHGTEGKLELFREGYIYTPHRKQPVFIENSSDLNTEHVNDFFDAIKNNRKPSADIETGLEALRPSHLAVAAYWSGKRMGFDNQKNKIIILTNISYRGKTDKRLLLSSEVS